MMTLDVMWLLICCALVFLMQAGFTCLETGFVRSKNSIHVAIKNVADFSISCFIFWAVGFSLMYGFENVGDSSAFFFSPSTIEGASPFMTSFFIFQMLFCGTATTLISGALAERTHFSSYLIIAVLVSGLIYPFFGHWVWESNLMPYLPGNHAGWLENMGFIDFAGSTVVHALAGWVALAALLVIGSRLGRFSPNNSPIQGHDMTKASLGMFLLWFGWLGFNGGSVLQFNDHVPTVLLNTILGGVGGMFSAMMGGWLWKRHYLKPEFPINGSLAGLVAITASANAIDASDALWIGMGGGIMMLLGMYLLNKYRIDDAIGVVPVHLFAGIWGTMAVAIFADVTSFAADTSRLEQFGIQALGTFVCAIWAFGVSYVVLSLLNRVFPLRISPEDEKRGLNISEHGASTEVFDLLQQMETHQQLADFSKHVAVQPHTEVGQIAHQYNRVLDTAHAAHQELQLKAMSYAAFQHVMDGIMTTDKQGIILDTNIAADRLFNYQQGELIGKNMRILMSRKSHMVLQRMLDDQSIQPTEVKGLYLGDHVFPLELSAKGFELDGKQRWTWMLRDLTKQKEVEEKISQLATVVKQADDAIMVTNAAGIIQYVNPAFENLSGFSVDESVGKRPNIVKSGQHDQTFYKKLWACIRSGKTWNGNFINQTKDGHHYEVDQTISPIFDAQNTIIGYTSVQRDVTERNRIQAKVEHAQRLESLGVLAGGIAHDFNNLLSAIMGHAGLALAHTKPQEKQYQHLQGIHHAAESAAELCQQMLAYSGKGEFVRQRIDLSQLIEGMTDLLRSSLAKKTLFSLNLAADLAYIFADKGQVQQVVMNIIINASEALDEKKGSVDIATTQQKLKAADISLLEGADDMLPGMFICFCVQDTGSGMDGSTIQKMFDPFFTTKFTGRGLGMSAVLGILRTLHGGLSIDSTLGQGTTLKVYFPVAEQTEVAQNQDMVEPMQPLSAVPTGEKIKVLVVDDEDLVCHVIQEILTQAGYDVLIAHDGEEGVQVFDQHRDVDLILLDWMMPKVGGEEAYRMIRQRDEQVNVLICSGFSAEEITHHFDGSKHIDFIKKPFDPDKLMSAVDKMLRTSTDISL